MLRRYRTAPKKRGCLFPLLALAVCVLLLRVFSTQLLTAAAKPLIEDDGLRKADAILVLGGDGYGDRTLKGAELAKAGYAPFVYVSGAPRLMGYLSTDQIQFAEQKGFPAALFREARLPIDAESTRTEAQFLGPYLTGQGVKSILLVTSNFHTKRAAKLWRQVNPNIQVTVVPSLDPWNYFTPEGWWKTRPGQKIFLYEWMKTISLYLGV